MIKITKERTTANSTYPKVGVSFSADTFVVKERLYLRMNIFAEKSTPSQSGKTLAANIIDRTTLTERPK
jgi:hypothetical protein